ncbi:hypothetical protein M2448_003870 [Dysgonomonas sp. PF1-14]|uniref:hypothetical protein n=2 Tax=Dysgonomonas TaxID=156973 RepID=UPI002475A7C3|nr:hypothetical protein [Dysgonomonas sp. PF1-14]MDH6310918.1 hypothetical protein [Dysgonomonas sp. PF1-14]
MKQEYYRLKLKNEAICERTKCLIIRTLKDNDGRIILERTKEEEADDDYPLIAILPGRKDVYSICVTDVYIDENETIYADGIDDDTGYRKEGFIIEENQYSDILYFIGYVLDWFDDMDEKNVLNSLNSSIMELACNLAEKEMVDTYGKLPEDFADSKEECYTEEYQNIFNPLYDKYYNKLSELADFELRAL